MPKGKEALVSFFGIVYAGGFYTFLDPELPEARLKIMAEVLKPAVILTDNTHAAMAEEYFPEMRCLRVEKLTQRRSIQDIWKKSGSSSWMWIRCM